MFSCNLSNPQYSKHERNEDDEIEQHLLFVFLFADKIPDEHARGESSNDVVDNHDYRHGRPRNEK